MLNKPAGYVTTRRDNLNRPIEYWVRVTIREGKNRQVRRMFAAVGCEVRRLIRIRFNPLELGALPAGDWRHLTGQEAAAMQQAVVV